MAEQDLLFSSTFDAATAENKTIRDTAFQAASAGRGMVGAHANALGGGLFAQGLAKMAGWKTPAQRKAEIITNILKGTSNLDRNDPKNLIAIADKLFREGLPGEAEKFMKRAREIEVQNRTFKLNQGTLEVSRGNLTVQQERLEHDKSVAADESKRLWAGHEQGKYEFEVGKDFNENQFAYQKSQDEIFNMISNKKLGIEDALLLLKTNDQVFSQNQTGVENRQRDRAYEMDMMRVKATIALGWADHNLNTKQFDWAKYVDTAGMDLADKKQAYIEKQTEIENKVMYENLGLDKAKLLLSQNELNFAEARAEIGDAQFDKTFGLEQKLADVEIKYKEAQTERVQLENKYYPATQKLHNKLIEAQTLANRTTIAADGSTLMIADVDEDGNLTGTMHKATDADGNILTDHNIAKGFGMTAGQKRTIDIVYDEFKRVYYTGGSLTEDAQWQVPEEFKYNKDTNPKGLESVPDFKTFAEMSVKNGGFGGDPDVIAILDSAFGKNAGGPDGNYVDHLMATVKMDRKDNQVVMFDSNQKPYLMDFNMDELANTYNLSPDVLNKTAVFKDAPNTDKDTNAQMIAEIQLHRDFYDEGSTEYIKYQTMIDNFVQGLNPNLSKDAITPSDAATTQGPGGQMVEDTQAQVVAEVPSALEPETEGQAKALENRTNEAVRMTGISREDGEWKQVVRVHPNKQNSAEYKKGTDGKWYKWSAKSQATSVLGQTVGDISGTMDTALEGVISKVQSIYK